MKEFKFIFPTFYPDFTSLMLLSQLDAIDLKKKKKNLYPAPKSV